LRQVLNQLGVNRVTETAVSSWFCLLPSFLCPILANALFRFSALSAKHIGPAAFYPTLLLLLLLLLLVVQPR
jgi:hypothetical protein